MVERKRNFLIDENISYCVGGMVYSGNSDWNVFTDVQRKG